MRTYLTGDLGRRGTGGILTHAGRRDFQVKVRGYRIEVSEIESALRAMKGISDAVVVDRETQPGKVRLVAYFVAAESEPVAARTLRERLAQTLPDYMIPSAFVPMVAIPLTPNGKIDRARLPQPMPGRRDMDGPLKPPRNAFEIALVAIWREVFDVDSLGIDDDFLSLGGDSLHAAQIAEHVASRFNVKLAPGAALQLQTVAQMAELVAARIRARDSRGNG
jgi:acyl carrier protein